MKTTPSPIAPTFVSPAPADPDVTVGETVDVDVDVDVLVAGGGGATTEGAVVVIEDEDDGDGARGAPLFFPSPSPSGITSLGEVGQGTGSLSCAHATRAAAKCRYTTIPSPTRAPTTRAPGSRRVTG
jgi:hypothetical protein